MNRIAMAAWLACAFGAGWLLRDTRVVVEPVASLEQSTQEYPDEDVYEDADFDLAEQRVEQALYSEQARLQLELESVAPGVPGKTELYFLGIAGDGTQRVFGRELDYVKQQLAQRYDLQAHRITLINDRTRIGQVAMATRYSVEQALTTLTRAMNPDEDVLLIYMTSHGSEDHYFALDQEGMLLPDLAAENLQTLLDQSGIRWQVVIMSACFSGGVIPLLQNPDRLIITSAAADRASFGCSDDADMTYFGRALFEQSFPQTRQWTDMFTLADRWIEQREREEGMTPSLPQMAVGANILAQLARIDAKDGP